MVGRKKIFIISFHMFLAWNKEKRVMKYLRFRLECIEYHNSRNSLYWIGIFNCRKVFFKVVSRTQAKSIEANTNCFLRYFNTPKILDIWLIGNLLSCMLYEYIETDTYVSANVFLATWEIPNTTKIQAFKNMYCELYRNTKSSLIIWNYHSKYPSAELFEERLWGGRMEEFYGKGNNRLIQDIESILSEEHDIIRGYLSALDEQVGKTNKIGYCLSHWDFHEFNFWFQKTPLNTFTPIFFDLETFWQNPIFADIAIYYWNIVFQADEIYPRYSSSHASYAKKIDVRLRDKQIQMYVRHYLMPIIRLFHKQYPELKWKEELSWRLVMRIISVNNILQYDAKDKYKIYRALESVIKWLKNDTKSVPFTKRLDFIR